MVMYVKSNIEVLLRVVLLIDGKQYVINGN